MSKYNTYNLDLFELEEEANDWKKEWQDMPEFVQEDLTSYRKIIIHFRNNDDIKRFSELIGQRITEKQPSLWFPEMQPRRYSHLRYVRDKE